MIKAWIFLILAISTEVIGTLAMNASGRSGKILMYGLMYLFISSSYIFLSKALRKIPVGVAIATWEGLGTTLITLASIIFLNESVSLKKIVGISLAFGGIMLLHLGSSKKENKGISTL